MLAEQNKYQYSLVNDDEAEDKFRASRTPSTLLRKICANLVALLLLAAFGALCFITGRYSMPDNAQANIHLGTVSRVFEYNRTFGEQSSNKTVQAWESLFPAHNGFFNHPKIAPQRSALSVFHQLHCLNGIREGYWALYTAMNEGRIISDDDMPMMSSSPHIRHCIDLLRQSLMCRPDTTIELKDDEVGGVKGFGTEHLCKDWDMLVDFIIKWEEYGLTPEMIEEGRMKQMGGHDVHHTRAY